MTPAASPRTVIVLGPGGLPAVDLLAGAWLACEQHGIEPAEIRGVSAGAIVGALWAGGYEAESTIHDTLLMLDDDDLVQWRPFAKLRAYWRNHLLQPAPVARILHRLLVAGRPHWSGWPVGFSCTATLLDRDGIEPALHFTQHNCRDVALAVQASAAIPGFWPAVEIDGQEYADGCVSEALPIPLAEEYEHLIVLRPVRNTSYRERDRNVISRLLWAYERTSQKEAQIDRELISGDPRVTWIDLPIPSSQSALAFDHQLVAEGKKITERCLRRAGEARGYSGYRQGLRIVGNL